MGKHEVSLPSGRGKGWRNSGVKEEAQTAAPGGWGPAEALRSAEEQFALSHGAQLISQTYDSAPAAPGSFLGGVFCPGGAGAPFLEVVNMPLW